VIDTTVRARYVDVNSSNFNIFNCNLVIDSCNEILLTLFDTFQVVRERRRKGAVLNSLN
jgi:hypothetical protein